MGLDFKKTALAAGILGMVGAAHAGSFYDFSYGGPSAENIDTQSATTVQINVLDPGRVVDLNIEVVIDGGEGVGPNITRPVNGDTSTGFFDNLELTLSHAGVSVVLYAGNGNSPGRINQVDQDLVFNAVFDDAAFSTAPTEGSVNGSFMPVSPLSSFNNQFVAGVWELSITDTRTPYRYDGNDLVSWRIYGVSVPTPASLALFGIGFAGLSLFRRRRSSAGR